ncbi:oxidoreductase, short-chain dehydrogenase/reductase family [Aspergillus terreus]|uniref:Oxidoreductase, short-chain dehydrogenase/reductase family n=1 Tax=Aspergillus terreus TaxID=33178 RepID=A0A5M3Z9G1_ASPTE|nr:hypothetical protein ATETN484_0009059900 [Aspergillus terreus]GFF18050.1 oxidoreductase, short-chain dehydrogenase/reductase family [Aspergillus terreus]
MVTGAASGFGKGIAAKFVEEGAHVLIADISEQSGKQAAEEIGCSFAVADVTSEDSWKALLRQALEEFHQVDIIVNNAGTTYANKPTTLVSEKDYDLVMDVNVRSIYQSTKVILPYFLENSRPGVFIQVSSTAALRPRPGLTWYNASKAAVSVATKSMAVEFGPRNIRFNNVCPVVGSTGLTHLFIGKPDTEENRAPFASTIPLGRGSTPLDVANACCYLASDEAEFITGVDLQYGVDDHGLIKS